MQFCMENPILKLEKVFLLRAECFYEAAKLIYTRDSFANNGGSECLNV